MADSRRTVSGNLAKTLVAARQSAPSDRTPVFRHSSAAHLPAVTHDWKSQHTSPGQSVTPLHEVPFFFRSPLLAVNRSPGQPLTSDHAPRRPRVDDHASGIESSGQSHRSSIERSGRGGIMPASRSSGQLFSPNPSRVDDHDTDIASSGRFDRSGNRANQSHGGSPTLDCVDIASPGQIHESSIESSGPSSARDRVGLLCTQLPTPGSEGAASSEQYR